MGRASKVTATSSVAINGMAIASAATSSAMINGTAINSATTSSATINSTAIANTATSSAMINGTAIDRATINSAMINGTAINGSTITSSAIDSAATSSAHRFIKARDAAMRGVFLFCAVFSVVALSCICVFLFANGLPFIAKVGPANFFGTKWHLASGAYGILSMAVASLYVTALSTAIGVAVGLLTAISLYKFCPQRVVPPIRQMINLLAGIPSVIYGLFGMVAIVPLLRDNASPSGVGYGILAASLVLSVMILPTVVSVSLDALNAVPARYYEGALALGATSEQSVFRVMVPAAKSGIMAAVVLSIGRAIGETMAVIMVIGGAPAMPNSLFQSVRTLTANIAMGATELSGDAATALVAAGVVLFFFTLLLNASISLLKSGSAKSEGGV